MFSGSSCCAGFLEGRGRGHRARGHRRPGRDQLNDPQLPGLRRGSQRLPAGPGNLAAGWTFGTTFLFMRRAESLASEGGRYRLQPTDGSVLTSRAVVIATGAAYRRLGIPSLEALQGRGVFYGAAVSEAPAMRGRDVFVVGGGNSAGQTALHMAKEASRVAVLVRGQSPAASMSDYLIREIDATPNVDVTYGVQVAAGAGDGRCDR